MIQTRYHDLKGEPFIGAPPFLLRVTVDVDVIVSVHAVELGTLIHQVDLTKEWCGKRLPAVWTVRKTDDELVMDEGL